MSFLLKPFFIIFSRCFVNQGRGWFFLTFNALAVLSALAAYYFLGSFVSREANHLSSGQYFSFLVVGVATFQFFNVTLGSFSGQMRSIQQNGVLDQLFLARWRFEFSILSLLAVFIAYGIIQFLAYLLGAKIFFGFSIGILQLCKLVLALIIVGTTLAPWAFLTLAFVILFKKNDPIFILHSVLTALFSGVYFPRDILPDFFFTLGHFLPMTPALTLIRHLTSDSPLSLEPLQLAINLGLPMVFGLGVSLSLLQFAILRAKKNESIS